MHYTCDLYDGLDVSVPIALKTNAGFMTMDGSRRTYKLTISPPASATDSAYPFKINYGAYPLDYTLKVVSRLGWNPSNINYASNQELNVGEQDGFTVPLRNSGATVRLETDKP